MKTAPTIRFDIFMAGDIAVAKQICRQYCYAVGLCVHIEPIDYIYTGGEESGFRVGLINYPRFISNAVQLRNHAKTLAGVLLKELHQNSYTIVGPDDTEWCLRRREDLAAAE
jgi:hypothetical protein